jgi:phosphocarrier protein HPr
MSATLPKPPADETSPLRPADDSATVWGEAIVGNPGGLHMRPASVLNALCRRYSCQLTLHAGERTADPRSLMGLLLLAAEAGSTIRIEARGGDAQAACTAVAAFLTCEDPDHWHDAVDG